MTQRAPCLMVQGTGSGVGKSLLTAALCRLFARAGYRVTPFKAQNMALNAAVVDGGDIDRGGVFAALVGTLALLEPADRARVAGLIVNKLRGDGSILTPGLDELAARTGVPVLGVVPWIDERLVPAEDSLDLEAFALGDGGADAIEIAVVRLPRIANFDDFEPLAAEPGVRVRFATTPAALRAADLVVLPGSKSTMADLAWLHETRLPAAVVAAASAGRPVLGVCGGFQMLGEALGDPERVESERAAAVGLGLLPVTTTFTREKTTVRVRVRVAASGLFRGAAGGAPAAYEIHAGRPGVTPRAPRPFPTVDGRGAAVNDPEGAMNARGNVVGTYLHGLFAAGTLRRSLLCLLAELRGRPADARWGAPDADRYERLADIVGGALDLTAIAKLAQLPFPRA